MDPCGKSFSFVLLIKNVSSHVGLYNMVCPVVCVVLFISCLDIQAFLFFLCDLVVHDWLEMFFLIECIGLVIIITTVGSQAMKYWYLLPMCQKGTSSSRVGHQTHYRSYRGQFLWVRWPNQQCQALQGQQLVSPPGKGPISLDQAIYKVKWSIFITAVSKTSLYPKE